MWTGGIVIVVFLASMILIGVYFSHRQQSTDRYFAAQRSIPGWAAGISLFATLVSSVTFIAYPAAGYEGRWSLFVPGLMSPVVVVFAVLVFIPIYRNVVRISAYEYIEKRFDKPIRLYSTLAFSLNNFAKMGFVFYLVALTVNGVTGWSIWGTLLVCGVVTVFYTLIGGVEAVIWTEVIQGVLLWAGGFIALGYTLLAAPGGAGTALRLARDNHMFNFGQTAFDWSQPTILILLLWGFLEAMQKYAADQTIVQRYIVATSDREARKGAYVSVALSLPSGALFTLIGTCLWAFYQSSGDTLPPSIVKSEQVFPYFLATRIPTLFGALIVAGMLSAAMSTVASVLNGLSSVFVEDFYRLFRPRATDQQRLRVGKLLVGLFGALSTVIAALLAETEVTALALWYTIASIVSAGIVGLFLLAFLSTRVNRHGIYAGVGAALVFTVWATLTMNGSQTFDLGLLDQPVHSYWIGVFANAIVGVVGYGASLLFPHPAADMRQLTIWGWLDEQRKVAL